MKILLHISDYSEQSVVTEEETTEYSFITVPAHK